MIQKLHKFLEAPTEENVCKTLKEDTYGRIEKVCQFADTLASADDNYVIALDGKWGSGKTFFVKEVQKVLEAAAADEEIELIPRCDSQFASLKEKQHLATLYYDAWEHDTDDNPLLSIIYELMSDKRINHCFIDDEEVLASLEKMLKAIIRLVSPDRAKAIENLIDFFKGASKTVKAVQSAQEKQDDLNTCLPKLFEQLMKNTGRKRIVFFIDELDRCRPDFAVRLLESMKHYFTSPDVIFVL
ncbi:MAG: P-loop NTPase fold protein [Selenomonadaceae bacterium]|nr:P-loop NTPase fold protein [Selenomonadaceae bacterium]